MGITNSNKEVNVSQITCGGTFQVTLGLSAAPDISENPVDIVLVLDRSGSMAGSPLENLKLGADTFIDIIDETTDSTQDGQIGSGSHIGIVSFSGSASADTQLITSVAHSKIILLLHQWHFPLLHPFLTLLLPTKRSLSCLQTGKRLPEFLLHRSRRRSVIRGSLFTVSV